MKSEDADLGFVGVARDASGFGRQDLGEFASQESLEVDVHEKATVVSEEDLVERVDAAFLDEREDSRRDEDVIKAFRATAVGAGFSFGTMGGGVRVGEVALSDEVGDAALRVAEALVEVPTEDDVGSFFLPGFDGLCQIGDELLARIGVEDAFASQEVPLLMVGRRGARGADVAVTHSVGGDDNEGFAVFGVHLDERPAAQPMGVGAGLLVAPAEFV